MPAVGGSRGGGGALHRVNKPATRRTDADLGSSRRGPRLRPFVMFAVAEIVQVVQARSHRVLSRHLLNGLVYLIGVAGIIGATGHLFKADDVARSIGWPTGSPFQWEVGVADLGWGVLGVLSPSYGRDFLAGDDHRVVDLPARRGRRTREADDRGEELRPGERGRRVRRRRARPRVPDRAVPHIRRAGLTRSRRAALHCRP